MQALSQQTRGAKAAASAQQRSSRAQSRVVRCQAQRPERQGGLKPELAAAGLAAAACLCAPAAHAAQEVMQLAEVDVSLAIGGSAAVAGLGALLVATDPQKR
jgi:hypothetical protein